MKKILCSLLFFVSIGCFFTLRAEIEPVIVHLQSTPQRPILTYDVPEGKILVVEHIWGSEISGIHITIGDLNFTMPVQAGTPGTSIKLGSTWHLKAPTSLVMQDIFLLGYLADPADLSGGGAQNSNILTGIELR
jgi:hypothetical protein